MNVICTGRRVNLKPNFIEMVEKKLAKLDRFFSENAKAQVTVTVDKNSQTVEITVRDTGLIIRAEKSAERMEDAFAEVFDLLLRRVVKNRKRLGDKLTHAAELPAYEEAEVEEYEVIREKRFAMKPCTVEEAIMQMDLIGHNFYMYHSAENDQIQVVYRRADGGYGVLIPENS